MRSADRGKAGAPPPPPHTPISHAPAEEPYDLTRAPHPVLPPSVRAAASVKTTRPYGVKAAKLRNW